MSDVDTWRWAVSGYVARISAGRVRERSLRAEWCAVALRVWLAFGRVAGVRLRSVCVRVAPARPRAAGTSNGAKVAGRGGVWMESGRSVTLTVTVRTGHPCVCVSE